MTPAAVLMEMYKEHAVQARQHETQRQLMVTGAIAIAAALVTITAQSLKTGSHSLWLILPGIFLVALGIFGTMFCRKLYERNRLHTDIMAKFREELEQRVGIDLTAMRKIAETTHNGKFPWLHNKDLHIFWEALTGSIAIIGVVLVALVIFAN